MSCLEITRGVACAVASGRAAPRAQRRFSSVLPLLLLLSIVGGAARADGSRIEQYSAPAFDRPMVGPNGEVMPRIYVPLRPAQPREVEDEFAPGASTAFGARHEAAPAATGDGSGGKTLTPVTAAEK